MVKCHDTVGSDLCPSVNFLHDFLVVPVENCVDLRLLGLHLAKEQLEVHVRPDVAVVILVSVLEQKLRG